jgi:hypothetical protein
VLAAKFHSFATVNSQKLRIRDLPRGQLLFQPIGVKENQDKAKGLYVVYIR